MADQVYLKLKRSITMKLVGITVSLIAFMIILPLPDNPFHNKDPLLLFYTSIVGGIGFIHLIEFFRNKADAGSHNGAMTGAYMFLAMAIISFVFSGSIFFELYDPLTDIGFYNAILLVVLGLGIIVMIASVLPESVRGKTLSAWVKSR